MPKKPLSINLAEPKIDLAEEILDWSLKIGKILIILVEVVALSAFLYRFVLDIQVGNLESEIKLKQTVLYNFKDRENTYRNLQDRLSLATSLTKDNSKVFKIFNDILNLVPQGITVNNISLDESGIAMIINVNSVSALSSFTTGLKNYSNVQSISVDKIESKTASSTLTVSMTITLKKG